MPVLRPIAVPAEQLWGKAVLFKHMREELDDAKSIGWREEARLVARNSILLAAAALCPLGVVMAVIVMIIWDVYDYIPSLMGNIAYYYPVSSLLGIVLAIYMHNHKYYTGSMLVALAPFLWIPTFFVAWVYWAFFN